MGAAAGYGQGQAAAYKDELARQADAQQFALLQEEFERKNRLTDAQIGNYESLGKQREATVKSIEAKLSATDPMTSAKVRELIAKGDLDGAQAELAQSNSVLAKARTDEVYAGRIPMEQANASYRRFRPIYDQALLKEKYAALDQRGQQFAQALAQRMQIANMGDETKLAVASMATQRMMMGMQQKAAIDAALDEYKAQWQVYRDAMNPRNAMLSGQDAARPQAPTAPTFNFNMGQSGQGGAPGAGGPTIPNAFQGGGTSPFTLPQYGGRNAPAIPNTRQGVGTRLLQEVGQPPTPAARAQAATARGTKPMEEQAIQAVVSGQITAEQLYDSIPFKSLPPQTQASIRAKLGGSAPMPAPALTPAPTPAPSPKKVSMGGGGAPQTPFGLMAEMG